MDRFRRTYHRLRLGSNTGDGGVAAAHPSQDALPKSSVERNGTSLGSQEWQKERRGEVERSFLQGVLKLEEAAPERLLPVQIRGKGGKLVFKTSSQNTLCIEWGRVLKD